MGIKTPILSWILCILSEKNNRLQSWLLWLQLLPRLEESCCFPHQDIKATRCQQGEDLLWDKNPANNGKLQDVFAIVKDGIIVQVGAQSPQFRIHTGTCWLEEALLQHFNDTWAEYFAFLCIKPHFTRMRLCPLRCIIYIKISPASQHDFYVPPRFRQQRHMYVWGETGGRNIFFKHSLSWKCGRCQHSKGSTDVEMWLFEKKELNTKTGSVQLNWSPKGQW